MLPKKLLINEIKSNKDLVIYIDNYLVEEPSIEFIEKYIEEHDSIFLTINDKKYLL